MVEYKLLTALSADDLSNKVNFHLRHGWTVHGSPQVARGSINDDKMYWNANMYIQAVVRWSEGISKAIAEGEVISLKECPDLDA